MTANELLAVYLVAWLWILGIALGAVPLLLIHQLTGGRWGEPLRATWIAAASTLPLVALAFVPVALGMHALYPWTRDGAPAAWWLNTPFFVVRAVAYFAAWTAIARWCVREPGPLRGTIRASTIGLIGYMLTATLASVDWLMSLTPEWHSTVFGLLFTAGQVLGAFAFSVIVATSGPTRLEDPDVGNDLGNLLLTFTMLWAYLAFMQYLIIWIGNLPHDIGWYVVRTNTSWRWLGLALIVGGFALPFAALLLRTVKRVPARLFAVACGVLAMRLVDLYWGVVPAFRGEGLALGPADPFIVAIVGAGWLVAFRRRRHAFRPRPAHAA